MNFVSAGLVKDIQTRAMRNSIVYIKSRRECGVAGRLHVVEDAVEAAWGAYQAVTSSSQRICERRSRRVFLASNHHDYTLPLVSLGTAVASVSRTIVPSYALIVLAIYAARPLARFRI